VDRHLGQAQVGQLFHVQALPGLLHRDLVVEQVVAALAPQHFQGRQVIAGAQQAQVERRVFEDRVDVRPVAVAADQNQRLAGQIVGNARHRCTGAVIEVEVDLTESMPTLQRMGGQLGLALGAWPEVDAAILQRRIEPCAR